MKIHPVDIRRRFAAISGRCVAVFCAAMVFGSIAVRAADYTYSANGTPGAHDGGGTWATAGTVANVLRWSLDGTGNPTVWPNNPEDSVIIGGGGTPGTIALSSSVVINVSNITFNAVSAGMYTLSPGGSATTRFNFSPNATINVASGVIASNRVNLVGANGFTKTGDGVLGWGGATDGSNYTGVIIVNAGTMIVNSGSGGRYVVGVGGMKVNGGFVSIGVTTNGVASGNSNEQIEDTASLTNAGGLIDIQVNETLGSLVLESGSITNTYTNGNKTVTVTGSILLQGGQISGNSVRAFRLDGTASLTKNTPGTSIVGPSLVGFYNGATVISGGTLKLLGGASVLTNTPTITMSSSATLDVSELLATYTVRSIQTFIGSGTITGNVALATGAGIRPGTNTLKLKILGDLTVNNNTISVDAGGGSIPVGLYRLIDYSGAKTGTFNATPTIVNGSADDVATIDQATPGQINLIVGTPCISAGIGADPSDKTGTVGGTATFTVSGSGSSPTYQWQLSTDGGTIFNNVVTGSGGTTPSYTTPALVPGDVGKKYRAIVSVACDSSSITSQVATLTAVTVPPIYRSAGSGNWNANGTWEQSFNSGGSWDPATNTPTADNTTNIVVRSGHIVTVTAPVSIDDTLIQAGAEVDASGATLTIADGLASVDCDVLGVIQVNNVANSGVTAAPSSSLRFENASKFIWARNSVIGVPTATWAIGSTCEIQLAANGSHTGLGQSFHHFTWNWPGMNSQVNMSGLLTTVNGDFTIENAGTTVASGNTVRLSNGDITLNSVLTVGGNVHIKNGGLLMLGGAVTGSSITMNVHGNFIIEPTGFLDSRSSGISNAAYIVFNGPGASSLTNSGAISHSNGGSPYLWNVATGKTLTLGSGNLTLFSTTNGHDSITVAGTLNFNGNQVTGTGSGNLVVNSGGALTGQGTSQLTTSLASIDYGVSGTTLNLPGLPNNLTTGDNFKLFDAAVYSGSFATIIPTSTPVTGFSWDQLQLPVTGTLFVGSAAAPVLKINQVIRSGLNLALIGTGGPALGTFQVLTRTNVSDPLAAWTVWTTGAFDGSGNFAVTNALNPGDTRSFFIIKKDP